MSKGRKLAGSIHPHPCLRSCTLGNLRVRKPRAISIAVLIISPDNVGDSSVPTHVQEVPRPVRSEPNPLNKGRFDRWKSTTSASAKLLLRGVSESADAFMPLKSVAGGLCFILDNCEVW